MRICHHFLCIVCLPVRDSHRCEKLHYKGFEEIKKEKEERLLEKEDIFYDTISEASFDEDFYDAVSGTSSGVDGYEDAISFQRMSYPEDLMVKFLDPCLEDEQCDTDEAEASKKKSLKKRFKSLFWCSSRVKD